MKTVTVTVVPVLLGVAVLTIPGLLFVILSNLMPGPWAPQHIQQSSTNGWLSDRNLPTLPSLQVHLDDLVTNLNSLPTLTRGRSWMIWLLT